ncbi:OSCP, subunit 5 of the stator stalk of mitochondrial F1F0 ATP synthase [Irpex rosettiformis]|uniref:OSCP, subunit 5 of the stator stalk of mitochondrial F1F0 ATP synthase n=1 Tax=Irpex rosettiformis TaxID=378272 RepID=A0ACB8TST6_9APHY|nr:OSCP, subunit 5 of the stator stalk of mitochondrial F1F0 ATP synthase [Irpex rosettiformis]
MLRTSLRTAAAPAGIGRRAASTIALKYSNAVFSAALKKSAADLDKVQSELNAISTTIKNTPQLDSFVSNPTLSLSDRVIGLQALFKQAETVTPKKAPLSDITKNLFSVLSENGRLTEAEGVIEGFNELVAVHKGELTVTITSAAPLPKDAQTRLEGTLKQSQAAQAAKTVKVVNKVNPSILGGLIVDFGEKSIDLSVASRVGKLNSLLQQSV